MNPSDESANHGKLKPFPRLAHHEDFTRAIVLCPEMRVKLALTACRRAGLFHALRQHRSAVYKGMSKRNEGTNS